MSTHLKIEGLEKIFTDRDSKRDFVAVNNFNLSVPQGHLVTLLGPSGCGKTTVLRMIAGFEEASSGKIYLNDRNITETPPHLRNAAMVFQSYALFPHFNVRENILYGLKIRKIHKDLCEEKLSVCLDRVGLKGLENRRPSELSGGQQQRVALARAIIVEPEILLFDEPLSNLDAKLREAMRNEIRDIQQSLKITSVYVTHDQSEAMAISDTVIVMRKGEIEQEGTAMEIFNQPTSAFVADFMGATNIFPTELELTSDGRYRAKVLGNWTALAQAPKTQPKKAGCVLRPEFLRLSQKESPWEIQLIGHSYLGLFHEFRGKLRSGENIVTRQEHMDFDLKAKKAYLHVDTKNLAVVEMAPSK
ncbi:MAG: polyamine ABC transporter ATP-binding protein [Deltaproteobacteria bacterium CG11_big_fil_rev_8_21_14_0_20_45_16]|nr:MAG: polyamine ABC transporter ATP-binding protein [Deltaproteobacteria bacterium CG11_big_fil_rev_8_21_14_0_20_45_16]